LPTTLLLHISTLLTRFTARASAASLLHLGLKRLSSKMQDDVFGLFLRLCKDETPLVRRLAAQNLEAWARLLSDAPTKQKDLVAAYKNFINDDQVRDSPVVEKP